jgi:hypothetical protein
LVYRQPAGAVGLTLLYSLTKVCSACALSFLSFTTVKKIELIVIKFMRVYERKGRTKHGERMRLIAIYPSKYR